MSTVRITDTEPLKPGLFNEICDFATEGIYAVDLERQVVYWNGAAEKISGYDTRFVLGRRCADRMLRHCDETGRILCGHACPLQAVMSDGQSRTADVFLLHREGRRVPVRVRGEVIRGEEGSIIGSVEFFHDLTQPMTMLEELKAAQTREKLDPLTGIGNRRLIEEALEVLRNDGAAMKPTGVVFFDVDHFKQVNDTYGHAVGDRTLREIALTIAGELRSADVVGRWGGEEFVVLAPGVDVDAIGPLAERIRALVSAILIPHDAGEFAPTISAGATVTRGGEKPETVIARADGLMYLSKQKGRNQITVG